MGQKYGPAPWIFTGDALYQLNLVKASEARKHIPDEFKIVSLFGWTMGGVYLARYTDSPVGAFDELVVLAGLVWNPPTSCAWAQRVYVSNKSARNHGLQSVGLPSRLAAFSQSSQPHVKAAKVSARKAVKSSWWCAPASTKDNKPTTDCAVIVKNIERGKRGLKTPVAEFLLPEGLSQKGPRIPLTLPNFSGGTVDHPGLLHYTCKMLANIRPVSSLREVKNDVSKANPAEDVSHVLKGKPLLCLAFSDLVMRVPEAQPWFPKQGSGGKLVAV